MPFDSKNSKNTGMRELVKNSHIYQAENALTGLQCQMIIDAFEAHPTESHRGIAAKESDDIEHRFTVTPVDRDKEHWWAIDSMLCDACGQVCRDLAKHNDFFSVNEIYDRGYEIMRYMPGERIEWHSDYTSEGNIGRSAVVLWYLNDLQPDQGGRTTFKDFDVSIIPRAGNVVAYPPFWTHVHEGGVLKYGVKYLVITWLVLG